MASGWGFASHLVQITCFHILGEKGNHLRPICVAYYGVVMAS